MLRWRTLFFIKNMEPFSNKYLMSLIPRETFWINFAIDLKQGKEMAPWKWCKKKASVYQQMLRVMRILGSFKIKNKTAKLNWTMMLLILKILLIRITHLCFSQLWQINIILDLSPRPAGVHKIMCWHQKNQKGKKSTNSNLSVIKQQHRPMGELT